MDTLGEMVEETEKPAEQQVATEGTTEQASTGTDTAGTSTEEYITDTEAPREDDGENLSSDGKYQSSDGKHQSSTQSQPVSPAQYDSEPQHPQVPTTPKDLIAQGASFLSGLAATLKSPEATEQLVNSLIETDAETGQTSLKIPVPDKQTVRNLLDIVGKLFG